MRESRRNPQRLPGQGAEPYRQRFSKAGGLFSQINCDIEYFACADAYQLALRRRDLIMQAAQHVFFRARDVVLNEMYGDAGLAQKSRCVEAFEKTAAFIFEYDWFDKFQLGQVKIFNLQSASR